MADALIRARGLVKRFGDLVAVDGIDFDVHEGESFGFLGPNGAGKTSTMKMIGATSPRTSGELSVFGLDPDHSGPAIRARLGVVPQLDNLEPILTCADNLMIYGRYFDIPRRVIRERTDELLEFVQLAERRDDPVEPLSGGMKRRLTIARALINEPDLLILDEPTTGLDPQARHVVWDRLTSLKKRGATLIITSHYMDEAEQLCDRLVVMDKGRIVAHGAPADLILEHVGREVLEVRLADDVATEPILARLDGLAERAEVLPDRIILPVEDADAAYARVLETGVEPTSHLVRRATLEDVFLRLTGRTLVD
ncbi:MAG: ATP-binding cassette domain-containing protein [Nitriliruptorales bacterium]|nr:ATP-binding cassette domain-containing protein [Nitriliruptorales bacterium]